MDTSGWLKGNTHTHSNRSDGDAPPEQVVAWYARRGYDFLAVTDHNRYLGRDRLARLAPAARDNPGGDKERSDQPARSGRPMVLLAGSELSYKSGVTQRPVDVCALGGRGLADPPGIRVPFIDGDAGATVRSAVAAARSAGCLPIVCHPCFRWALSADDLLALPGSYLLEVWNPSSNCNTFGGGGADGPERIWSRLLSAGRRVWAVAADDAHRLADPGAPPRDGGGLAWVRVGAQRRSAGAILASLRAGRFYASTGVELAEWSAGPRQYSLRVSPVGDRKYTIHLLGAHDRKLAVAHGLEARYRPAGDEGYVRARVEDTEGARCWTQPWFVRPPARRRR